VRRNFFARAHSKPRLPFPVPLFLLAWGCDPVGLAPTPPDEAERKTIAMMGGRGKVLDAARGAIGERQYQWAAESSRSTSIPPPLGRGGIALLR
jgi:hypothetical protein